jgi:hypothetical protein
VIPYSLLSDFRYAFILAGRLRALSAFVLYIVGLIDVEQLVEWELAGETEVPGENTPLVCFVNHKIYMTWLKPGPPRWESGK